MPTPEKNLPSDVPKVKRARTKASREAPSPPLGSSPAGVAVVKDAIASRAFELYVQDGRVDGRDVEHWLRAERELARGY